MLGVITKARLPTDNRVRVKSPYLATHKGPFAADRRFDRFSIGDQGLWIACFNRLGVGNKIMC
ncbi:Uncharacterised protein [Vibrio cholerae]|nr:Uncharacterised protein [Vibrio cholerae]